MKNSGYYFVVFFIYLFLSQFSITAQTSKEPRCLFSQLAGSQHPAESPPVLQDTSLRVALLLVQFADWQSNIDARGSVGFSYWDPNDPQTYIIPNKFRYPHFWEMYFSRNTYIDSLPLTSPTIHPHAGSHNIAIYGSFRNFWHEVTHGEFDPIPAVTHPEETDSMFCGTIAFQS